MNYITIGTRRTDGDLDILATLNNKHMTPEAFSDLVQCLAVTLANHAGPVEILERQDTPDTVNTDEDEE